MNIRIRDLLLLRTTNSSETLRESAENKTAVTALISYKICITARASQSPAGSGF